MLTAYSYEEIPRKFKPQVKKELEKYHSNSEGTYFDETLDTHTRNVSVIVEEGCGAYYYLIGHWADEHGSGIKKIIVPNTLSDLTITILIDQNM